MTGWLAERTHFQDLTSLECRGLSVNTVQGLFVVNANARAPALTPEQQKAALVPLVSGYPWSSPGNADACSYIRKDRGAAADFQYCYLDVLYAFLRLGMCVPKACGPEDIALGLNAAFTKTTNMQLDSKLQLAPMTVCGSPRFPYVAGTYVMIVVTLMLLVLVAVGTAVEWVSQRQMALVRTNRQTTSEQELYNQLPLEP
jgi:hypothetical protein